MLEIINRPLVVSQGGFLSTLAAGLASGLITMRLGVRVDNYLENKSVAKELKRQGIDPRDVR